MRGKVRRGGFGGEDGIEEYIEEEGIGIVIEEKNKYEERI